MTRGAARTVARALGLAAVLVGGWASQDPARAADLDKVRAFMAVTGYEVVIDSLQLGAMSGPGLVGSAPETFGRQYTELARKVFDPAEMRDRAGRMMASVMGDDVLAHAAEFYASDLGQRLVAAENAAHMTDNAERLEVGEPLLQRLEVENPARVQMLRDMSDAIGQDEISEKAIVEMQLRYIQAAIAAGAMDSRLSERALREMLTQGYREAAPAIERSGLIGNAYTYRDFSDADVQAYVDALREPDMQKAYQIMNAVQMQIMIERYEALGAQLAGLSPQQDL